MRLGLPSVKGWRTLTGSVNDLYEAHLVVYDELFPIGIFYRRVIRLNGANQMEIESRRAENTPLQLKCEEWIRDEINHADLPTKQFRVNYGGIDQRGVENMRGWHT